MACLLSVDKLMKLENAKLSYLHTFTFPEPEPSIRDCARMFHNFFSTTGAGRRLGLRAVWSLQRGERTGRLHFHLVSGVRWDAATMWRELPKYGFGRYDVRPPKPAHLAFYVARYVGRSGYLEKGTRPWGAVGFPKVVQANVESVTFSLSRVTPTPMWVLHAWFRLKLGGENFARRVAFLTKHWSETIDETPMSFLKSLNEMQKQELATEAQSGVYPVFVGEYRGYTITARQNKDKMSGATVDSATVSHVVMVGTETLKVSEYLPPGASADAVKVPAQQGETVVVRVSSWQKNQFGTSIRGFIKPLTALPLAPAAAVPAKKP